MQKNFPPVTLSNTHLLQPLHNLQHRRANLRVLVGQIHDLHHFLPVCVRILAAGFRAIFVYGTVIFSVEEGAGRRFQYIILVLVDPQVLLDKISGTHAQGFGNALDIVLVKDGTGSLAAVRALEAVCLLKNLLVSRMEKIIHFTGVFFLHSLQEFPVLDGFGLGL